MNRFIALTALATVMLIGSGCANNDEMDRLRTDIQANRDAAARAQSTADNALHNSQEALNAANAANTRIDRMFKKAMYK
jgi:outer membrane murein-binding lipoprotein Lpp